jgi:hypothetical protein
MKSASLSQASNLEFVRYFRDLPQRRVSALGERHAIQRPVGTTSEPYRSAAAPSANRARAVNQSRGVMVYIGLPPNQ